MTTSSWSGCCLESYLIHKWRNNSVETGRNNPSVELVVGQGVQRVPGIVYYKLWCCVFRYTHIGYQYTTDYKSMNLETQSELWAGQ